MATRPAEPRAAALALALLLHVLLVWLFVAQPAPRSAATPSQGPRPLFLRLLTLTDDAPPGAPAAAAQREVHAQPRARRRAAAPPQPRVAVPFEAPPSTVAQGAAPAASAASAPLLRLLDTEATQRAIREAARTPSIGEQAALASQAPRMLAPGERLGRQVEQAAIGDCLKGEYAGGGMGLLSLPFWLAAEARGKCQR